MILGKMQIPFVSSAPVEFLGYTVAGVTGDGDASIAYPDNVQSGDLLILLIAKIYGSAPSISGWTLIEDIGYDSRSSGIRAISMYQVASGSLSGTLTVPGSASGWSTDGMIVTMNHFRYNKSSSIYTDPITKNT